MIEAFTLALRQLGDKPILSVFLKSFLLTLLILAALGGALWFSAHGLARWFGLDEAKSGIAAFAALMAALSAGWLLFRAVAVAVVGLFADQVVVAVERRHYPEALARARDVPLGRSIAMGLGAAGRTIGINLLFLPIYLMLIVTGIGTPIGFFVVNALLLGRDLGDMIAARHVDMAALPEWRARTRVPRFLLGAAITALLLIPFVNFVAPVLGAAMATHLFHRKHMI